ncbi:hypothetical protein SAMN04488029_0430 [Reichenbachiella faecimaris]|uniref:Cytochrome b561 n=1 Tax=Reichenbachiella faecimaris TaxID=692418 RepID=A0A1W2G5Z6_REIFA|nr:hypothetical protein [Reichenbachiella faecimaris]SMD32090.1 hypothetical protein SAMN04488029_0430 [Reichenbachiella faecimaris]
MYNVLLFAHSWLRWIVLILALINIYKSFVGTRGNLTYSKSEKSLAAAFVGSLHLTFLFGLILYFISPYAYQAFAGSESVMKNATLRFWAVEHAFVMFIAIAMASIGKAKAKKATTDSEKFKAQLIFFSIALVLMLSRIPWGEAGRLFRF